MTESQIRQTIVSVAESFLGAVEGDARHKAVIDTYNSHTPRARGYKMTYTAAWCAAFVSAIGIRCGLTDIMPTEVSCSKLISLYKALGRWQEDDSYIPAPGDLLMYDWEDSGKGDNKGAPNHVGIVVSVADGVIRVIEGNLNASPKDVVGYRDIAVNGKYIRGYCLPDYASKATEDAPTEPEVPAPKKLAEKYGKEITVTLHQLSKGCKGEEVRALQILLTGRGYDVGEAGADGVYGAKTKAAVTACQRDNGLDVDGIAGKDTITALMRNEGLA